MENQIRRPSVDPNKVCYYLLRLAEEGSHFHGDVRIKFHEGRIVNVHSDESLDLNMFRVDE
jgi:hypothetical protein